MRGQNQRFEIQRVDQNHRLRDLHDRVQRITSNLELTSTQLQLGGLLAVIRGAVG